MENKIILVINKMIQKSWLINEVTESRTTKGEYFFNFNNEYVWSIMPNKLTPKNFSIFYYPENQDIDTLVLLPEDMQKFVAYHSMDFKTQEADESFAELYNIVKEKALGMDQVLDKILRI